MEEITENHLINLGIGDGKVIIQIEMDGKFSSLSTISLSTLRTIQTFHDRSSIGETFITMVETLMRSEKDFK